MNNSLEDWAGAQRLTLALVFTDIVSSTNLGIAIGDGAMSNVRRAHFIHARFFISLFGGVEVKTAGDSFLVAFRTAVEALDFAVALHDDTGDDKVIIRAGLHVGAVRVEENDVFGATVNFTSRVMGIAKLGGIVVSRDAYSQIKFEKAPEHEALRFLSREYPLDGFEGTHKLSQVLTPKMSEVRKRRAALLELIDKPKSTAPAQKTTQTPPSSPSGIRVRRDNQNRGAVKLSTPPLTKPATENSNIISSLLGQSSKATSVETPGWLLKGFLDAGKIDKDKK